MESYMNDAATSLFRREPSGSILPWSKETARVALTQWKRSGLLSTPALYPAGIRIFKQGTESFDVFLLERGVVAFECQPSASAKDRSGIFALCLPGHLFGQASDPFSHSFSHGALALTSCSVYRISREKILKALQEGGELALFIIRQYLQNLLCARARASESTIRCTKVRFQQLLQELAGALEDRSPTGAIRLPLKDKELAGLLGISPQQFSVIKKEMEVERVITCSRENNRLALRGVTGTLKFFKAYRNKRVSSVA
jgi:CRP-like cAMP-binding protein